MLFNVCILVFFCLVLRFLFPGKKGIGNFLRGFLLLMELVMLMCVFNKKGANDLNLESE